MPFLSLNPTIPKHCCNSTTGCALSTQKYSMQTMPFYHTLVSQTLNVCTACILNTVLHAVQQQTSENCQKFTIIALLWIFIHLVHNFFLPTFGRAQMFYYVIAAHNLHIGSNTCDIHSRSCLPDKLSWASFFL